MDCPIQHLDCLIVAGGLFIGFEIIKSAFNCARFCCRTKIYNQRLKEKDRIIENLRADKKELRSIDESIKRMTTSLRVFNRKTSRIDWERTTLKKAFNALDEIDWTARAPTKSQTLQACLNINDPSMTFVKFMKFYLSREANSDGNKDNNLLAVYRLRFPRIDEIKMDDKKLKQIGTSIDR